MPSASAPHTTAFQRVRLVVVMSTATNTRTLAATRRADRDFHTALTPVRSVHAVVVHHRTPALLRECLNSLAEQVPAPMRVVVVDTGVERGQTKPPGLAGAEWIPTMTNIGYGAAANLGASGATADAILILNADAKPAPGAVAALLARLNSTPACAIVAPRMTGADGALQHNARSFPTLSTGLLGRTSPLTTGLLAVGRTPRQLAPARNGAAGPVDWVSGACLMVRRSDWLVLGGFDLDYWMYWEDADLCKRARRLGRETWFEPAATCMHHAGASGRSRRTIESFHQSAALYYERHLARSAPERHLARAALSARARLLSRRM